METQELNFEVPTWLAGLLIVLVGTTFTYGIVVRGSVLEPLMAWLWLLGAGITLFVVYLLYRFVIAVETIAAKL